jgi:hypothetical protein
MRERLTWLKSQVWLRLGREGHYLFSFRQRYLYWQQRH